LSYKPSEAKEEIFGITPRQDKIRFVVLSVEALGRVLLFLLLLSFLFILLAFPWLLVPLVFPFRHGCT
jgi:hypothetical protein